MTVTQGQAVQLTADYHVTDFALMPAGTRGIIRTEPTPMGSTMKMLVDFDPGISLWVTERSITPLTESMVVTG
jgi:hypothetical protein